MSFFSLSFFALLAAALALYYLLPGKAQWIVLLCASLLPASALANYVAYTWAFFFIWPLPSLQITRQVLPWVRKTAAAE